jgi:hypothetical protein
LNSKAYKKLLLVFSIIVTNAVIAQGLIEPVSKVGRAENKTLIIETVVPYKSYQYQPFLDILNISSNVDSKYKHPELTAKAYFLALTTKNYDAYLDCWTISSQQFMKDKDKQLGFTPDTWKSKWQTAFVGKTIVITHWVKYGKYILLNYKINSTPSPDTDEAVIVLTNENGFWKLTQDLRSDQFVTGWKSPVGRISVPSDVYLPPSSLK